MREVYSPVNLSETVLQALRYCFFVLRTHLPKRDRYSGSAVGIRYIENMAQLVRNISVHKKRNAFCSFVDPSTEPVPCFNFRTRCCFRLLRMDE